MTRHPAFVREVLVVQLLGVIVFATGLVAVFQPGSNWACFVIATLMFMLRNLISLVMMPPSLRRRYDPRHYPKRY